MRICLDGVHHTSCKLNGSGTLYTATRGAPIESLVVLCDEVGLEYLCTLLLFGMLDCDTDDTSYNPLKSKEDSCKTRTV